MDLVQYLGLSLLWLIDLYCNIAELFMFGPFAEQTKLIV